MFFLIADTQERNREVISDLEVNRSLLLEELEPLRYIDAFSSKLSNSEVEEISNRFQRRERVDVFVDILLKKEREIQNILYRELKRQNETYIVNNWTSSSTLLTAEQRSKNTQKIFLLFYVLLDNFFHTYRNVRSYKYYHIIDALERPKQCMFLIVPTPTASSRYTLHPPDP